ncbi:MAG TPA: YjbE family putative metal transport protein [Acetobacteraceae bacterium]|jgi:YjbE family integral membrane protein|nr:YjbE family putative metal transport protein [Acetobacteraceae bacterium]
MDVSSLLPELAALAQVLLIDLVLAGDNAVVVGLAVAGLEEGKKRRAIVLGVGAAALLRIGFAIGALGLLAVIGLQLAGGLLLLWVAWKSFREFSRTLRHPGRQAPQKPRSMAGAMGRIVLADLSMSLDNVLAVAGAAHAHPWVMVFGLALSVLLMGVAADLVSRLLERRRWIAWIGLLIVLSVALRMIWEGSFEVAGHLQRFR